MVSSWLGDQVSDLTSAMIVIGCHQPDVTSPCPLHPSTVAKWMGRSFYNIISVARVLKIFYSTFKTFTGNLQAVKRRSSGCLSSGWKPATWRVALIPGIWSHTVRKQP